MADTINYLDDNAISKGSDIIGFLNRVGGVAGTVGITGENMAALEARC
ncbi:phage tail tape measure protein [Diaphorobacter sp. HDW4A]|nr:phage tail tape measure protein [Diaphorobacter sp. HDW4A]